MRELSWKRLYCFYVNVYLPFKLCFLHQPQTKYKMTCSSASVEGCGPVGLKLRFLNIMPQFFEFSNCPIHIHKALIEPD